MKRLIFLFLTCCFSVYAQCSNTSYGGGITCSNTVLSSGGGTANETTACVGTTPVNCTGSTSFNPSAGNQVVIVFSNCGDSLCSAFSTKTIAISDNINNPETCFTASPHSPFDIQIGSSSNPGKQFNREYIFYCSSIPSGVTNITATCSVGSGCSFMFFYAEIWSGLSGGFDTDAVGSSTGNTCPETTMSLTISPTYTNVLLVGNVQTKADESQTISTTDQTVSQNVVGVLATGLFQTSAASHTLTTTWTGGDCWWTTMASLKTSSSVVSGGAPVKDKRNKIEKLDPLSYLFMGLPIAFLRRDQLEGLAIA